MWGCFELFGAEGIRTLRDLKGKAVATLGKGSAQYVLVASIATSVGLDLNRAVNWVDMREDDSNACSRKAKSKPTWRFLPMHGNWARA